MVKILEMGIPTARYAYISYMYVQNNKTNIPKNQSLSFEKMLFLRFQFSVQVQFSNDTKICCFAEKQCDGVYFCV